MITDSINAPASMQSDLIRSRRKVESIMKRMESLYITCYTLYYIYIIPPLVMPCARLELRHENIKCNMLSVMTKLCLQVALGGEKFSAPRSSSLIIDLQIYSVHQFNLKLNLIILSIYMVPYNSCISLK